MGHSGDDDDVVDERTHKMKMHWQNQLKVWYWLPFISIFTVANCYIRQPRANIHVVHYITHIKYTMWII